MKKSMVIVMSLVLVILSGCQSNSLPDTESFPETEPTISFSESKTEPTESESESTDMTDEITDIGYSKEHFIPQNKKISPRRSPSLRIPINQLLTSKMRM